MRAGIHTVNGARTGGGGRTAALARELLQSVADSPAQSACLLGALGAAALTSPAMAGAAALAGAGFLLWRPRTSVGLLGGGDLPGVKARPYSDAELCHVGRHAVTGESLRMTHDAMKQHFLVTGLPGRREQVLLGLAEGVVSKGSGLVYVSGHGSEAGYRALCDMAAKHGRGDDVLLVDLRRSGRGRTHTFNPFAKGSAETLAHTLAALAAERLGNDGGMWLGKLTAMTTGLMRVLVRRRCAGRPLLPSTVVEHLPLEVLVAMSEGREPWTDTDEDERLSIRSYLVSLPLFEPGRGSRQGQATREVHDAMRQAVAACLEPLAGEHAHVFEAANPTVDLHDVVRQRRLLAVLLPGIGRDAAETCALGQVFLATVKTALSAALGADGDEARADGPDIRPGQRSTPFACVLDDAGEYLVKGHGMLAAQARAAGFSMVYGADDLASLCGANEAEGASVAANVNTRIDFPAGWDEGVGGAPRGTLTFRRRDIPYEAHVARPSVPGARVEAADLVAMRDATLADCKAGEYRA